MKAQGNQKTSKCLTMNIKNINNSLSLRIITTIRIVVIFLMCGITTSCGDTCRVEGSPIKSARSLSHEQLVKLYSAMENMHAKYKGKGTAETVELPKLKGINYKHINLQYESIVIGGCFDNKTIIKFIGLQGTPTKNKKRSITLSWGELPLKNETLWEEM